MLSSITNTIAPVVKKIIFKTKRHAPEILMVCGAGMIIGASINACKKTVEAKDILESTVDELDSMTNDEKASSNKIKVYSKFAANMGRIYGPSILIGASGFAMMFGAHKILRDRNAALTVAYSNLFAAYNTYRDKVVQALGEEKEFQLRSGYSKDDIEYIDDDGKSKKVKNAKVITDTGSGHSIYARIFDETCPNWSRSPSSNLTFLRQSQCYANDKLRSEGVLFLNDVYQMLGFPRTSEGQIVGWIWDPSNPEIDSVVDFGIYDKIYKSDVKRDFINGYEPCIWLDFNVDGVVYDLI